MRLEVDVRGSLLRRLEDERVDEAHEWPVRDSVIRVEVVSGLVLRLGLGFEQRRPDRLCGANELLQLDDDVVP